jgi:hypothetical protein
MSPSVIELATSAAQLQRPIEALQAVAGLRSRLDELEELHVEDALRRGLSWSAIAGALGVSRQAVHKKYARRLEAGRPASRTSRSRGMLVTSEARRCVFFARRVAAALGHHEVSTAHLLLGLLREDGTHAHKALVSLGVTHDAALTAVRMRSRAEPKGGRRKKARPADELPVSAAGRRVFEQALREAVRLGGAHLAAEHLLLAVLREQGVAVKVLEQLGIEPGAVEERIHEVLAHRVGGRNVRLGA